MYDSYIMRRTQIYLDEQQADELRLRARARGTTASHQIREAIRHYLAQPDDDDGRLAALREAVESTFGIAPNLPPGDVYVRGLRDADVDRADELERRWRA